MASIDFKDSWWTNPRRSKLISLIKDEYLADGIVLHFWRTMRQSIHDKNPGISLDDFKLFPHYEKLIVAGIAFIDNSGTKVYAIGWEKHFKWIESQTINGKKGGLANAKRMLSEFKRNQAPKPIPIKIKEYTHMSSGDDACPLIDLYNSLVSNSVLPRCIKISRKRKDLATLRWKENNSPAYWTELIKYIIASEFHTGGADGRGWVANIDWLLRAGKHIELFEQLESKRKLISPKKSWTLDELKRIDAAAEKK